MAALFLVGSKKKL